MTRTFHSPYGRFLEIKPTLGEGKFIQQIKAPIFSKVVLAIEVM